MSAPGPTPPPGPGPAPPGGPNPPRHCENCFAELHGPHCHACGQAVQSPIRDLFQLLGDTITTLFALDGKFFRSMLPLLFSPGKLTREYLDGRRISFIRPFRLYLGISIALFLVISLNGTEGALQLEPPKPPTPPRVAGASPADAVEATTPVATPGPEAPATPDADPATPATAAAGSEVPEAPKSANKDKPRGGAVRERINNNFGLRQRPDGQGMVLQIAGRERDLRSEPLDIPGMPGWLDRFVNDQLLIIIENIGKVQGDQQELVDALLDKLPQSMFFLLPVFAALLKLLYIFRRRLYAEHLIVALHSHSFIFLVILVILLTADLAAWQPALEPAVLWLRGLLLAWIPLYLLLMQKRVYRQGWPMTLFKYLLTGTLYLFLLSLTVLIALVMAIRFL